MTREFKRKDGEEELNKILAGTSKEIPDLGINKLKGDTPDAQELIANRVEQQMRAKSKRPEQIIAYQSDIQGPYTSDMWQHERSFIERAHSLEAFNALFYNGPLNAGLHPIRDRGELIGLLDGIDREFEANPSGTVSYGIGLYLEFQGRDPKTQEPITENNIRKFKNPQF